MSKHRELTPRRRGAYSPETEPTAGAAAVGWGRPERESRTPVNMGNQPHRDNGEGVVVRPLPYPLEGSLIQHLDSTEITEQPDSRRGSRVPFSL